MKLPVEAWGSRKLPSCTHELVGFEKLPVEAWGSEKLPYDTYILVGFEKSPVEAWGSEKLLLTNESLTKLPFTTEFEKQPINA